MYLNQFELDLKYVSDEQKILSIMDEHKCLYEDAIKIDYNNNWKEKRRKFSLETRTITAMFERIFGKMQTKDCKKILIECITSIKDKRVLNFSGIYTVQVKFDYDNFISCDDYEKKQKTLELLMKGIQIIGQQEGWKIEPFEIAFSKICEANYINEWIWKKRVRSLDKNYSAMILCQHEVKLINLYIIIFDKNNIEIDRKLLISELPHEFAYAKHLGQLKWISNDEINLVSIKGDNSLVIKI